MKIKVITDKTSTRTEREYDAVGKILVSNAKQTYLNGEYPFNSEAEKNDTLAAIHGASISS